MAEEKTPGEQLSDMITNPEQELEVFDDEKVFNVPMNGSFAKRLQALTLWMTEKKNPEEILKVYEAIASDDENVKYDQFTLHLETMLILLKEMENQARSSNCLKKVKVKDINLFSQ
jgi:hypothetical protein